MSGLRDPLLLLAILRRLRALRAKLDEPATKTDIVIMAVAITVFFFLLTILGVGRS